MTEERLVSNKILPLRFVDVLREPLLTVFLKVYIQSQSLIHLIGHMNYLLSKLERSKKGVAVFRT